MEEKIGVIGLGYVGLPVALAFAKVYPGTVGFDIDAKKVDELRNGHDRTGETDDSELKDTKLVFSSNIEDLKGCTFFVVAVPTPIDEDRRPDLTPVRKASETVGRVLEPGGVVVYESTVYPGVTEDIAGPILAQVSGLDRSQFKLGYSPERINPGDKEHTLSRITKVVSGEDEETLERVAVAYEKIIEAGVHRAPSIKVAEAAKVIENSQRDINIAFVNELAIIFDRMGISTHDVLEAAATKWNFLKFFPGLVGGHCIGVDPYYLTTKSEQLGYHPFVILAGRRINDGMGTYVAEKLVKLLIQQDKPVKKARIGVLGVTFKEDVADIRNSRVIDIVNCLESYGATVLWHDPYADADEVRHEYGHEVCSESELRDLDGVIFAVSHRAYLEKGHKHWEGCLKPGGVFVDVKGGFRKQAFDPGTCYWSL